VENTSQSGIRYDQRIWRFDVGFTGNSAENGSTTVARSAARRDAKKNGNNDAANWQSLTQLIDVVSVISLHPSIKKTLDERRGFFCD
jgi:hypothetical protein